MIKWRWVQPVNRDVLELVVVKYENDQGFYLTPGDDGHLHWEEFQPYETYKHPALRIPGNVLAEIGGEMARDMFTPVLDYSKERDRIVERLRALREFVEDDLLEGRTS